MAGANAADKIITSENTCTVDVLGVSDNNATANTIATWGLIDYECPAGQYLLETETNVECTPCPTGSYCPGGTYTVESENKGTNICPSGYPNSDAGASADTQCYTACSVDMVAHATAVTGNDYFGSGVDTCDATACEMGYEVDGGGIELVEKDPLVPISLTDMGAGVRYVRADGTSYSYGNNVDAIPADSVTAPNTYAVAYNEGIIYGKASCQPKIDPALEYLQTNFDSISGGEMTIEEFESGMLPLAGKEKTDYAVKILTGVRDGSISESEMYKALLGVFMTEPNANYSTDSTGQYCYCQMDGFTPTGGTREIVTSAPWVYIYNDSSADGCAFSCADFCTSNLQHFSVPNLAFRAVAVGALSAVETGGMCKITENNCLAGQYLAIVGDAMMCVPCKTGSYCPGGVYTIESENKGTNICPSGYPNSDAGASADTQCYTACSVDMFAHATAVSGNDYYGTGVDTCSATACETGYHTDAKIQFVEKTPAVNVDFDTVNGFAVKNGNGEEMNENLPNSGLTENNTFAGSFSNGIMYGRASCQPSMDTGMEYMMNNIDAVMDGSMSVEDFRSGMTAIAGAVKAEFAVEYVNALKSGNMTEEEGMKFAAVFLANKNANYTTASAGKYCYLQVNGFAPSGGTKSDIAGLPWILYPEPFESDEECASNCIMSGAELVLQFAPVALGALDYAEISTCAANTINIDWNPDNNGEHIKNMCTYEGAIEVPADPVKPGYTFMGWKLLEENKL